MKKQAEIVKQRLEYHFKRDDGTWLIPKDLPFMNEFLNEVDRLCADNIKDVIDLPEVNRVEVIDENGRSYVNWKPNNKTSISIQDNDRTLKIFIKNK